MEVEAFFWRRRHHSFGGGGVHRNRLYWSMDGFFWHHLQQNWKKSWRCQKNYHRDFWIWPCQSTRAFCTGVLAFLFELFWHHLHLSWKKNWRWHQKNLEVVSNLCQIMKVGGGGVSRNRLYWSINAWIHTSRAFHLHRLRKNDASASNFLDLFDKDLTPPPKKYATFMIWQRFDTTSKFFWCHLQCFFSTEVEVLSKKFK